MIVALPPALLNRIAFAPPLPPDKLSIIQRAPLGYRLIKTVTYYPRPYWRPLGLSGQAVSDTGVIDYCLDDTKPDGGHPALMGFVALERAKDFLRLSKEERMKAVAKFYAETFRCPQLTQPIAYEDKDWSEDEYSGGCVTFYPPGALTGAGGGPELRQAWGRVRWGGRRRRGAWVGYMDGAGVGGGERAAREVLREMGRGEVREGQGERWLDEGEVGGKWVEGVLPSVGVDSVGGCYCCTFNCLVLLVGCLILI